MPDALLPGSIASGRVPGLDWYPAYWRGTRALVRPDLLVIHSGDKGDDPGRWLHNPVWSETPELEAARRAGRTRAGSLYLCKDRLWRRMGSAHIAARHASGGFVQQELLTVQAPHAGGSTCQGRAAVNSRSLGVELPAHEGPGLAEAWAELMTLVLPCAPSLRWWTLHRWIRAGKRDPVCWSDEVARARMRAWGLGEVR